MNIYLTIFLSSFKASIVMSLYHDAAWFAALGFGGYNMTLATMCAVAGSFLGEAFNFCIGWHLASKRNDWYTFDEAIYAKFKKYAKYSLFLLLLPFPDLPTFGQFFSIYVIFLGFFRQSVLSFALLALLGRLIYYSYYLLGISLI